jgi:pyruvate,water dikinase
MDDVGQVGGKNASLGELIRDLEPKGVKIPHGFAVTAEAYYHFLKETGLDVFIEKTLSGLNTKDLKELSRCAKLIRDAIRTAKLPADLAKEVRTSYARMEK